MMMNMKMMRMKKAINTINEDFFDDIEYVNNPELFISAISD